MARPVTEQSTGTVLRACGLVIRNQQVDFALGQVITADGQMRDALDAANAPIAWDGEIPPDSSTLAANERGKVRGT